jgi:hypothetical protein
LPPNFIAQQTAVRPETQADILTAIRSGVVYMDEDQVTSLYETKKESIAKEGRFGLKLLHDKFFATLVLSS